ncbi:MAG: NAD-dependent epimerase/dehydratase family protein, partial [Planctomycetes bacterium]|nr:NAD-dependent epimerase/dehydratase family protein [Planctomycetota bacterium]
MQLDKSGKLVTNTIRRALAGKDLVIFGEGSQEIDFIHVDDAAALNVAALERAERGE